MNAVTLALSARDDVLPEKDFRQRVINMVNAGARPVTLFAGGAPDAEHVPLTAVVDDGTAFTALRTIVSRARGFHALTDGIASFHVMEREILEEHGITPHGHPWLRPVRFPGTGADMARYPFYALKGLQVHEVAVGPIHAGVIEPGHFRFQCIGELVHHLEIQLGYQHRGVQALMMRRDPWTLSPLVETVAGDTSVAHAWAHAAAMELLADVAPTEEARLSRAVALELERVAMHLASLSGMATDIAFLQGAAAYGRLRTTVINASMSLCGSRFGRGWVRPGGVRTGWTREQSAALVVSLGKMERDLAIMRTRFLRSTSVQHRLRGTGVVTRPQAVDVGLVGLAARASGVGVDLRRRHDDAPVVVTETDGDCWARASVRVREIEESLHWLARTLRGHPEVNASMQARRALKPGMLAIAAVEGWRGEVVHHVETDGDGRVSAYRVQDPSLRNWMGLQLAARDNDISDFPICNKSFDLSYCGHDL